MFVRSWPGCSRRVRPGSRPRRSRDATWSAPVSRTVRRHARTWEFLLTRLKMPAESSPSMDDFSIDLAPRGTGDGTAEQCPVHASVSLEPAAPLVRYGLAGLRRCWMPEHGRWSHKYHLDGRRSPNESVTHSDL